jgi:hypothetical protein
MSQILDWPRSWIDQVEKTHFKSWPCTWRCILYHKWQVFPWHIWKPIRNKTKTHKICTFAYVLCNLRTSHSVPALSYHIPHRSPYNFWNAHVCVCLSQESKHIIIIIIIIIITNRDKKWTWQLSRQRFLVSELLPCLLVFFRHPTSMSRASGKVQRSELCPAPVQWSTSPFHFKMYTEGKCRYYIYI